MEKAGLNRDQLEAMTLRLRHAVSNGEYITVEMLQALLDQLQQEPIPARK